MAELPFKTKAPNEGGGLPFDTRPVAEERGGLPFDTRDADPSIPQEVIDEAFSLVSDELESDDFWNSRVVNSMQVGLSKGFANMDSLAANFMMVLDGAAQYLTDVTGLPKGEMFKTAEEHLRKRAQVQATAASMLESTGADQPVAQFIGQAPVELATLAAAIRLGGRVSPGGVGTATGFAGKGALEHAHQGPEEAAKAAIKEGAIGAVFGLADKVGLGRLGTAAVTGGGVATVEGLAGADAEEALTSGAIVGALSLILGSGARKEAPKRAPEFEVIDKGGKGQKPRLKLVNDKTKQEVESNLAEREAVKHLDSRLSQGEQTAIPMTLRSRSVQESTDRMNLKLVEAKKEAKESADDILRQDFRDVQLKDAQGNHVYPTFKNVRTEDDVAKMATQLSERWAPQIEASRRGVITDEQMKKLADELGYGSKEGARRVVSTLLERKPGELLRPEEVLAVRQMHADLSHEVMNLAKKIRSGEATDRIKADFIERVNLFRIVTAETAGLRAEAGRALRVWRAPITSDPSKAVSDLVQEFGTSGINLRHLADELVQAGHTGNMKNALVRSGFAKKMDKLYELWINGILSGPPTHIANLTSNAFVSMLSVPRTYLEATAGILSKDRGKITFGEANANLFGHILGYRDGFRLAAYALRTGERVGRASKFDFGRENVIGGAKGKLVRLPGTFLNAGDAFFKGIAYRQGVWREAWKLAEKEGLNAAMNPGAFRLRVAEHVQNLTKTRELIASGSVKEARELPIELQRYGVASQRIEHFAERQTFQNELGSIGKNVQSLAAQTPALRWIIPFIKTPTNITKMAVEHSPLATLSPKFWRRLSGKEGIRAQQEAIARWTIGLGASLTVGSLVAEGKLTGSAPEDPTLREAWYAAGNQPFSIKVGDKWVSYSRLEPIATIVGLTADVVNMHDQMTTDEEAQIMPLLINAFRENLVDKTFFQGISNIVSAVTQPEMFGEMMAGNMLSSFVPASGLVTSFERATDATVSRIPQGQGPLKFLEAAINRVRSRVPGLSEGLEPRIGLWGDPVVLSAGFNQEDVGLGELSHTFYETKQAPDLGPAEVVRLMQLPGEWSNRPTNLPRKGDIQGIEVGEKERTDLKMEIGQRARKAINDLVGTASYKAAPEWRKRELVGEAYEHVKKGVLIRWKTDLPPERKLDAELQRGEDKFVKPERRVLDWRR